MTEAKILKEILEYIKIKGLLIWRNNSGRRGGVSYGLKGSCDLIGCYKGLFVGIEVKEPKGKVSKDQVRFMLDINGAGGVAFVARSLEDFKTVFK